MRPRLKVGESPRHLSLVLALPVSVIYAVSACRVRIPSHTAAQIIECDQGRDKLDFILEPASIFPPGIVASRTCNSAGNRARLCVEHGGL